MVYDEQVNSPTCLVVGITAGEAKNPTKTVPRAIRNTFWRIVFFYIVTIFLLGITLSSDNPALLNTDDSAGTAAFTLVFKLGGIEAGAHVINAIILTRYDDKPNRYFQNWS